MRRILLSLFAVAALAGCEKSSVGDNVRDEYDNKADAVDAQAKQQQSPTARKIYEAHANAIREEGKDREKGLEGREPSSGQGETQGGGGK